LTRTESLAVVFVAAALYVACLVLESTGVIPASTILAETVAWPRRELPASFWIQHLGFTFGIWGIIWYLASGLSHALRQRDRELAATNARLEASIDERMRYMLQTAHQLKSPFAAIQANAQLLREGYCGEIPDRAKNVLDRIAQRCTMLSQQIVEMLQLANLRSEGQKSLPWTELDVVEVVRACVARVEPNARQRGISIETDLQPSSVLAVEDHLRMLVDNLLTNAVTYSHDNGTVSVTCRATSPDEVVLQVRDEGIGIPADKLPRIFEDYFRASEAVQHNSASTGLGLAIVRDVARSAWIAVEVESTVGKGTRFVLKIPTSPRHQAT
jgi:signal transduction histidine kinase